MAARALAMLTAAVLAVTIAPAVASHNEDVHSKQLRLIANLDQGGRYRQGSDLAFWGNMAVLGNYDNPGGFKLVDISDPDAPSLVGQLECPGPQNDVSIWEDLVVLSVDSPRADDKCGADGVSGATVATGEDFWEGIRIVDISNPAKPEQITAVETDCGSHTHTLVPEPEKGRLLVYVLSYPLNPQGPTCNPVSHRKISVVEVPLDRPANAKVIGTPDVSPAVGCHDVTVFLRPQLAAAACISETQLWDISDPEEPEVIAHIVNPAINIHHSTTFSWDGNTIVIGDELGGAAASPGCFTEGHAPIGALWFYDISDRESPELAGWFQTQNSTESLFCTAHNFNTVPLFSERDVLVTGWYNGGTIVIDFTDPSAPERLAFYIPMTGGQAASWSSYWYNDKIYSNNFDEDVNSTTETSRGFDVYNYTGKALDPAATLTHLNPQVQEDIPGVGQKRPAGGGGSGPKVLGRQTPATGEGEAVAIGVALLAVASLMARRLRRTQG